MTETCKKHGIEYEIKESEICGLTMNFGSCPICEEEIEKEQIEKEKRDKQEARISRMKQMNIEPMYYESTLDNFIPQTPEQTRALEYAREMVRTKTGKLVLIGSNGTGKTHIAVSVMRIIGGSIFTMYEISTRIRASYIHGAKETELEIVDELARLPMLAIDEIGRTKGSEAETNWLSYIVDKRNSRRLPLILISNKHDKKTCPENGCKNCLENYISEDIMSRLSTDGHLVRLNGEDYRKKDRQKKHNGI
jgi:DNA replication protein DnaC